MSSQADENQGIVLGVVFGVIALVIALVVGLSIQHKGAQGAAKATAAEPTALPAAVASEVASAANATAAADGASVTVENGVVKFFFASGKSDVAKGGDEALAAVVAGVVAGKKALISGFHDAAGDPVKNAELAKLRAFAVRDALVRLGAAQDKIELKKPEETTAVGPADQARRVEVTLQ